MSVRRVMTGYTVGIGGLVTAYFASPALRLPVGVAIGLLSIVALGYGIRIHRPQRAYAWWLLAGGVLVFTIGDALYLAGGSGQSGVSDSSAGAASDVFYLLMLPVVGTGLLGLTRANPAARDRSGLLDLVIFSTSGAFLLWVFVLHRWLLAPGPLPFERSALSTYVLGAALVFVATVRLVMTNRSNRSALLLLIGAGGLLAADLSYGAATLGEGWRVGGAAEFGWFLFYGAWGAAGLHPSMTMLTERADPPPQEVGRVRLILLGLAALAAPAVLLLQALTGEVREGAVIAVASGVCFVLVLHRLSDVADAHRVAVARERTLRLAGAALVSARDTAEVERAVREAVGRLLPGRPHTIVLSLHRSDGVPAPATSIWGPAAGSAYYPPPSAATARRARLLRVRMLQPALAEQLRGFEHAVLCPLVLDERAAGIPRVGALLVGADATVFPSLGDALEVLGSQAALALERISLSQEISRRDSEEYFRSLVQHTADVILIVGDDHRVRYASPAVQTVLGVDPADCTDLSSVVHPDDQPALLAMLTGRSDPADAGAGRSDPADAGAGRSDPADPREPAGATPERVGEWMQWSARRPDGGPVDLEVSCRDLRRDRSVRGFVLTMRDTTERRRLERELRHRAGHDTLTGLANRASYQDRVHGAVERARESGRTVGALSIDLDEFTAINDSHGHTVGDALLAAAGRRLGEIVGASGLVGRLGGDEFAVLVPEADGPEQVEQLAAHLVDAFSEPLTAGAHVVSGSVSIGVATTADAGDAGELLRRADMALYVAKGAGKGRWSSYQSELHTAIVEKLELRSALADAVDTSSFGIEYQPIVDMRDGRALGFEALVRWTHPARGPVPPQQFIALAEETGLIDPLGQWVLREAVSAVGRWGPAAASGPPAPPTVGLNGGPPVAPAAPLAGAPNRGPVAAGPVGAAANRGPLVNGVPAQPAPPGQTVGEEPPEGGSEPVGRADSGEVALPYVSVNVSARQLRTPGFVGQVRAALAAAGVPASRVLLEITESLLLRDEEPVWAELSELRTHGLRVAIDDFGTGFSSLSYLQQMPIDVLKLDRSFTETVATSRRQRLLVEGIIRLASTLGLQIIAEGVETERERMVLMDMGCVYAQGYLFSRPVPEPEVAGWLKKTSISPVGVLGRPA
nr:EAL domain-containing protein [Micromonospora sp. DSM 115978]